MRMLVIIAGLGMAFMLYALFHFVRESARTRMARHQRPGAGTSKDTPEKFAGVAGRVRAIDSVRKPLSRAEKAFAHDGNGGERVLVRRDWN
jgi:hypothetical protein